MYDFTKVKGNKIGLTSIVNSPLLPFVTKNVSDDGELFKSHKKDKNGNIVYRKPYRIAEYKGLSFSYSNIENPSNFQISGSLHKYFNDGEHNYNAFDKINVDQVLNDLQDKFSIDLKACNVENLEIGVNIHLPNDLTAGVLIDGCLFHSRKRFVTLKDNQWGNYIQCEHSQYIIKVYDKGLQYRKLGYLIQDEILRFEIKFIKLEKLEKETGITTLASLLTCKPETIKKLLSNEWNRILFYDPTLPLDEKNLKYSYPKYWQELGSRMSIIHPTKKSNSAYYKNLKKYQKLVDTKSQKIHLKIDQLIQNNIQELFDEGITFDHLPILSKLTPIQRICPVTNLQIDMQKKDSNLLSNTGLKHLEKFNPQRFAFIKKQLLTGYSNKYEKDIYSQISKQIRNRYFNNPDNFTQPTLF